MSSEVSTLLVSVVLPAIFNFSASESDESSDDDTNALDLIFCLCFDPNLSSLDFVSFDLPLGLRALLKDRHKGHLIAA